MKSSKELPMILDLISQKFGLLLKNKTEIIQIKNNEVLVAINQKNLDLAKQKMGTVLKFEKNIEAINILNPILERLQKNCDSMLTKKECPISLRPPLDSVLYASTRLQLEDLKQLKEIITKMYGGDYVKVAINNEDKIVNQDLISKLNEANISEETIKGRLAEAIKELKSKIKASSLKKEEKDMFGDTVDNTIQIKPQSDGTFPIPISCLKDDKYDPFGGDTIKTITNEETIKAGDNILDILSGKTTETMPLSVANPDNKKNPYEETLDDLFGPTIEPVASGRTSGLKISLKLAQGNSSMDPFDINNKDKIKDAFDVNTIMDEKTIP